MIFCGIDPGDKGAIAFIKEGGEFIRVDSFDCFRTTYHFLKDYSECNNGMFACIEKLWGFPVSSAAVNFNLGGHYTTNLFILNLLSIPSMDIAAKSWQSKILNFKGSNKNQESKRASIAYVSKRFPHLNFATKTKKDIDLSSGMTDAICLALYARYVHLNKI